MLTTNCVTAPNDVERGDTILKSPSRPLSGPRSVQWPGLVMARSLLMIYVCIYSPPPGVHPCCGPPAPRRLLLPQLSLPGQAAQTGCQEGPSHRGAGDDVNHYIMILIIIITIYYTTMQYILYLRSQCFFRRHIHIFNFSIIYIYSCLSNLIWL